MYLIIAAIAIIMVVVGFLLGNKSKGQQQGNAELVDNLRSQLADLNNKLKTQEETSSSQSELIKTLTSERDVQKAHAENFSQQLASQKEDFEKQLTAQKEDFEKQLNNHKEDAKLSIDAERDRSAKRETELKATFEKQTADLKSSYETQIRELKKSHSEQLALTKDGTEKQIEALKQMNKEQVESQLKLIKEQMQTTSEEVLKRRQEELGERNREQVSKIIDPLQQSLKSMQEAFDKSKAQQSEALTRLDATIRTNMEKSIALGETADRLTRALTGEVKVRGNFGELKLKQLLEDLELKEGEQFDTQETLRDKAGKSAKGDDGKGLVPDFILHFPNNRHVVVDSKMSLTDYERYMNEEDGSPKKTEYLKAHIASVRAQVKRLAKKEYTKYLPSGYNKLNFAIMYVPIEGALNLALLNDNTL